MKDDIPPENKIVIKIKTFLRIELIHRNRDRARKGKSSNFPKNVHA